MPNKPRADILAPTWSILAELDRAAAEWDAMPDCYKPVIVADYWPLPKREPHA